MPFIFHYHSACPIFHFIHRSPDHLCGDVLKLSFHLNLRLIYSERQGLLNTCALRYPQYKLSHGFLTGEDGAQEWPIPNNTKPYQTKPNQTKPNTKAWTEGPKLYSFRFGTARLNLLYLYCLSTINATY